VETGDSGISVFTSIHEFSLFCIMSPSCVELRRIHVLSCEVEFMMVTIPDIGATF